MSEMELLCGNHTKYNEIKEWINNQLNTNQKYISLNSILFICGNSGIGKTYSINHICKVLNLYVINISTINCWNSDELKELLIRNTTSSMLQILQNNKQRKIIIIDDFESLMAIDRTINTVLYNILSSIKIKNIPIICISSNDIIKKIGLLKNKCKIIYIPNPTDNDLLKIFNKNNKKENLIKQCNGNISLFLNKVNNASDNIDDNISFEILYSKYYNFRNIVRLVSTDHWLIPLKYHENLPNELKMKKCNLKELNNIYNEFMYNMIIFDQFINKNSDIAVYYFALSIHNIVTLSYKKNIKNNEYSFTKILSYLSLQKKNIKKTYSSLFPLYQIGTYHINIIGRNNIFFN